MGLIAFLEAIQTDLQDVAGLRSEENIRERI